MLNRLLRVIRAHRAQRYSAASPAGHQGIFGGATARISWGACPVNSGSVHRLTAAHGVACIVDNLDTVNLTSEIIKLRIVVRESIDVLSFLQVSYAVCEISPIRSAARTALCLFCFGLGYRRRFATISSDPKYNCQHHWRFQQQSSMVPPHWLLQPLLLLQGRSWHHFPAARLRVHIAWVIYQLLQSQNCCEGTGLAKVRSNGPSVGQS